MVSVSVPIWLTLIRMLLAMHWSMEIADRSFGRMWPHVLATSLGYGGFLAVLTVAFLVRRRWLRRAA